MLEENEKVAVRHVLSAIQPSKLRNRLESHIQSSHHELKKDFKGSIAYINKVTNAFVLIDGGSMSDAPPSTGGASKGANGKSGRNEHDKKGGAKSFDSPSEPLCLWEPHKSHGIPQELQDCRS